MNKVCETGQIDIKYPSIEQQLLFFWTHSCTGSQISEDTFTIRNPHRLHRYVSVLQSV